MRPKSKRFHTSAWMERLIPVLLLVLTLALLTTIIIIIMSLLGLTPA